MFEDSNDITGMGVLIVEDDKDNLVFLERLLKSKGLTVCTATDGESAMSMAESMLPDLILLDISLPDIDGFEVLSRLKQTYLLKKTPVVCLSALNDDKNIIRGLMEGAVDYITKPFNPDELSARVHNHLLLRLANKRIEHYNKERDRYYAILTHDLRSPFSGIIGLANVLDSQYSELNDEEKKEIISSLKVSISNHYQLLDEFLLWTKIQRGIAPLKMENANLHNLVENQISILSGLANGKTIRIKNHIEEQLFVLVDKKMISSVIANLLSNALKFTHSGGKIEVFAKNENQMLSVSVKDNGIGINEDEISDLFDMNKSDSTYGTNYERGSGLGLILCREIIEHLKGEIFVESKFGYGSEFTFVIPNHLSV